MADFGDETSSAAGDLAYLSESIPFSDKINIVTTPFNTVTKVFELTIPRGKKLVLTNMELKPVEGTLGSLQVDADITFADAFEDNIFLHQSGTLINDRFSKSLTQTLELVGDGARKLIANTTIYETDQADPIFCRLYVRGFYLDTEAINTATTIQARPVSKIETIRVEQSGADALNVIWNAPKDDGGNPITSYTVYRSKTQSDLSNLSSIPTGTFSSIVNTPSSEVDIIFYDNDKDAKLEDATTYYYRVVAATAAGIQTSSASDIVSGTTTADFPASPLSIFVSQDNTSETLMNVVCSPSTDTGGVDLVGMKVELSYAPYTSWQTVSAKTDGLTTTVSPIIGKSFKLRISVINSANKTSQPLVTTSAYKKNLTVRPSLSLAVNSTTGAVTVTSSYSSSLSVNPNTVFLYRVADGVKTIIKTTKGAFLDSTIVDSNPPLNKTVGYYIELSINDSSIESTTEQIDVPAIRPTAPQNPQAREVDDTTITLTWAQSTSFGGGTPTGYTIEYATDSSFTSPTTIQIADHRTLTHTISTLTANTTYYFRIFTKTIEYATGNPYTSTVNATTLTESFGAGTQDLVVSSNTTLGATVAQYNNLTINTGVTLYLNQTILKIKGNYTQNGTGKIVVLKTGCPGGVKGTTAPGRGGATSSGYVRRRFVTRSVPPTNATKTPPTTAVSCTSIEDAEELQNILLTESFESRFRQLIGGRGSNGTAAETSGNGGNHGTSGRWSNRWRNGTRGGNGGKAADGVDGVKGGGKAAIYVKTIVSKITVDATGNNGNNGNRGTATPGQAGGGPSGRPGGAGSAGGAASANGTLGSPGSDGGFVYLLYNTVPSVKTSFLPTSSTTGAAISSTGFSRYGMRVVNTSSALHDKNIDSAAFKLKKVGLPTGTAYCEVYNSSNTLVHTFDTLDVSELTTSFVLNYFEGRPYVLQTGDNIVIRYEGGDASNYIEIETSSSGYDGANTVPVRYNTSFGTITDDVLFEVSEVSIDVDVAGGLGGFNGGTATGTHPLTTRAASGNDGLRFITSLTEYLNSVQ